MSYPCNLEILSMVDCVDSIETCIARDGILIIDLVHCTWELFPSFAAFFGFSCCLFGLCWGVFLDLHYGWSPSSLQLSAAFFLVLFLGSLNIQCSCIFWRLNIHCCSCWSLQFQPPALHVIILVFTMICISESAHMTL